MSNSLIVIEGNLTKDSKALEKGEAYSVAYNHRKDGEKGEAVFFDVFLGAENNPRAAAKGARVRVTGRLTAKANPDDQYKPYLRIQAYDVFVFPERAKEGGAA